MSPQERFAAAVHGGDVLITGGSGGIGLAIATALLPYRPRLHLVARDAARLARAADALRAAGASPDAVHTHVCDCTDARAVHALADHLATQGRVVRLIVTAAGSTRPGRFLELPSDTFSTLMRNNYDGTVHVLRAFLPPLRAAGGPGLVLTVGSVASLLGVYGMTAYCAAKFAVRGLTASLRQEMAPHDIHVALLCPPDTHTAMLHAEVPLRPAETEALSPSHDAIAPEVVARAAVDGLRRGRREILPGQTAWVPALAQRLVPGLLARLMDRTVATTRANAAAASRGGAGAP
jgi:3-dehydrosphinganine reductase